MSRTPLPAGVLSTALLAFVIAQSSMAPPDLAMQQAHRAEKEVFGGRWRGPLHGIPYGVKDLLATRGIPAKLVIGTRAAPDFLAHAWVECDGQPVLSPGDGSFARLVEL